MTTPPSFAFCAFSFLAQWQESECALHKALSSSHPTEDDILKALSYFQVSRTFKGLREPGNTKIVLDAFIHIRDDRTLLTPEEKVDRLASSFQRTFKQFNLSAATKLLWLSNRKSFIIYDARAVRALTHHFPHRGCDNSYTEYSNAWRKEFEKVQDEIQPAVEILPTGRVFMRSCPPDMQELVRMANETWFTERVFDIFLWEVGAPQ